MGETVGMLLWTITLIGLITIATGVVGAFALAIRPLNGVDIVLISVIALPLGYYLLSEASLFLPVVLVAILASIAITWNDWK